MNLHLVPESACCSALHTYTNTIMPMAEVCYQYLHTRRSWLPGSWQFLLEDDLCLMSSTWPEQCQQGCLTAERDVLRAWHPRSPSLWQWPTICECPVCHLLHLFGHNTQNLKSTLPTIQWICWGMHQVHQTCTPMSQVQQCQSTACPTSTPSHTHQHQASIPSRAIVPVPTQNNHSSQDLQQWSILHKFCDHINTCSEASKSQADKCSKTLAPLYAGHPYAMYNNLRKIWIPATVICVLPWNSYQVHTQQWFNILLHVEAPLWMQCQSSWCCPK